MRHRSLVVVLCCSWLAGCPLATEADLAAVRDRDGDGIASEAFGGKDCDDTDDSVYPGAPDLPYDGIDSDCRGDDDFDVDGDGVPSGLDLDDETPEDCDDDDPTVGAASVGAWADLDGDGYGAGDARTVCPGVGDVALQSGDCNDSDAGVNPGVAEVWYDGVDQDCDGADDDQDGDGVSLAEDCDDTDATVSGETAWYPDADSDGFGDDDLSLGVLACTAPVGFVASASDCDDTAPLVNPGEVERCDDDDVDEDCSGAADDLDPGVVGSFTTFYEDEDGDGFGTDVSVSACDAPMGHALATGDCADDPTDESFLPLVAAQLTPETAWYSDGDADGFGDPEGFTGRISCEPQPFLAPNGDDCADDDRDAYPGAPDSPMVVSPLASATRMADEDCGGDSDLQTETDSDGLVWPLPASFTLPVAECADAIDVWVVAADGSGDFDDIQAAVIAADACDRIQVREGTYRPFSVPRSVVIAAYPGEEVVIEGGPAQRVGVAIGSDDVVVHGLTVRGFDIGVYVEGQAVLEWVTIEQSTFGLQAVDGEAIVFGGLFRELSVPMLLSGDAEARISETTFEDNAAASGITGLAGETEGDRPSLHIYRTDMRRNSTSEGFIVGVFRDLYLRRVGWADSSGPMVVAGELERADLLGIDVVDSVVTTSMIALAGTTDSSVLLDRVEVHDSFWTPGVGILDPSFVGLLNFSEAIVQRLDLSGNEVFDEGEAPWLGIFRYDIFDIFDMDVTVRNVAIAANGGTGIMMVEGVIDNATLVGLDYAVQPLSGLLLAEEVQVRNSILWDNGGLVRAEPNGIALGLLLAENGGLSIEDSLVFPADDNASCTQCGSSPPPGFLRYDRALPPMMWDLRLRPESPHLSTDPSLLLDWPCTGSSDNAISVNTGAVEDQIGAFGSRGAGVADPFAYNSCWPVDYDDPQIMYNQWRSAFVAHVPSDDLDDDGLSNKEEFDLGTLPDEADSDADGVIDGIDTAPLDGTSW